MGARNPIVTRMNLTLVRPSVIEGPEVLPSAHMNRPRVSRLLFDESETAEGIARRIVRAFDPGETFCVKGKFFRVSGARIANETVPDNVTGSKYTLVLNIGEPDPTPPVVETVVKLPEPPVEVQPPVSEPPPSAIVQSQIPKKSTSKSGEYPVVREEAAQVTKEGPPKVQVSPGQVWESKDRRRNTFFTVASVDNEFVHTVKGGKVSLKRMRNYRLVETSGVVPQQSSG